MGGSRALIRLDWPQAESIVQEYAASGGSLEAVCARAILFQQAVKRKDVEKADGLRKQLQAVVSDKKCSSEDRNAACIGLFDVEWPGQEEWYISLFSDKTLRRMHTEHMLLIPLHYPVRMNPDHWIPVIAKLVESTDRTVHDTAVSCLIQFNLEMARKDALRPLLPWLSDANWSSACDRLRLMQSLDRVDLPESVPGLIKVAERENGWELAGAANALAFYRARQSVPALKKSLDRCHVEHRRLEIINAIVMLDGFTAEEIAAAVEAFAVRISTPQGREEMSGIFDDYPKKRLPAKISLGYHLCCCCPSKPEAAARLLDRADALEKKKPAVADAIRRSIESWPGKAVDACVLGRIRGKTADADVIQAAIARRKSLQSNLPDELRAMMAEPGTVCGWATVLSGNAEQETRMLDGSDAEAQRALLAGARLAGEPLPVDRIGRMLKKASGDKKTLGDLAFAAERYLESEHSPAAYQILYDRHPGEALIFGGRQNGDPGHSTYPQFDAWEKRLQKEVLAKDGLTEIYALLSAGYWGDDGQIIVRVRRDGATLAVCPRGSKKETIREFSPAELKRLRAFLSENRVNDLPFLETGVCDGMQYEYLHLTPSGGRRVFMNNPGSSTSINSVYDWLTTFMQDIAAGRNVE